MGRIHCSICSLLRPPEYILPLAGTPWLPLETAPALELATAALIYPQLVTPRKGRSSLSGEQIQTKASQMCTPWIWVRAPAVEYSWLCSAWFRAEHPNYISSNQRASFPFIKQASHALILYTCILSRNIVVI
jgi:hypothetical protein